MVMGGIYTEKNRRTRQQILQAFLSMLETKPFESTTVGDIARTAKINRGTFYLHYVDKFDLLEQLEQQLLAELGSHLDELQSRYLSALAIEQEQAQLADALFGFIQLRGPMLKLLLSEHGRAGFHLRFRDAFTAKVRLNLERHEGFSARLNVPMDYFLAFITSAFLGLIDQWVRDGMDKTPQEMTAIYMGIIRFIERRERSV